MTVNIIHGTPDNDSLTGTSGNDLFELQQGGTDSAQGLDGDDGFAFANSFDASDTVDGGTGNDTVKLNGDSYSDGITLGAATLTSVEKIQMSAGHDYGLTTVDANVGAGARLIVDAISLQSGEALTFDGSAETDGSFKFAGGAGTNDLTGGANNDAFILRLDGEQCDVHGGGGNDVFLMAGALEATDVIDGGAGNDVVELQGVDVSDSLTLSATSFASVERLILGHGFDYNLTENDGNVAAHAKLILVDRDLDPGSNTLFFDGSAETDGHFNFKPEDSIATLIGGARSDRFDLSSATEDTVTGGGGPDKIIAASGASDTFIYNAARESTSTHFDTISNVDFGSDTFVAPWGTVTSFTNFGGGALSLATFDSDIQTAIGAALFSHRAIVFDASTGDLAGRSFLVIDVNGVTGYQAGHDLVIDVTGFTGLGGGD